MESRIGTTLSDVNPGSELWRAQSDNVRATYYKLPWRFRTRNGVLLPSDFDELMWFHTPRIITNTLEAAAPVPFLENEAGWIPIGSGSTSVDGARALLVPMWMEGFGHYSRLWGTGLASYYRVDVYRNSYLCVAQVMPDAFKQPNYADVKSGIGFTRFEAYAAECMIMPVALGPYDGETGQFTLHINRNGDFRTEFIKPMQIMQIALLAGILPARYKEEIKKNFAMPPLTTAGIEEERTTLAEILYALRYALHLPAFSQVFYSTTNFQQDPELATFQRMGFSFRELVNYDTPLLPQPKYGRVGQLRYVTFRGRNECEAMIRSLFNAQFLREGADFLTGV